MAPCQGSLNVPIRIAQQGDPTWICYSMLDLFGLWNLYPKMLAFELRPCTVVLHAYADPQVRGFGQLSLGPPHTYFLSLIQVTNQYLQYPNFVPTL